MSSTASPADFSWAAYPPPPDLPAPIINDPALPLVSIVTPSYNQGAYIRETMDSILSQDYPNIEYWVIDGGSTDQTVSILREYEADARFHWISERDQGQSDAINKGWSRCRGDALAWLCSDDVYCPGAIRSQVDYLQAHPDVDAVYSNAISMSADGKPIRKDWARPFSLYDLLRIDFIPQSTIFLRRRLIERTGIVDTSLHYGMDHDYWLRAALYHTFAYHSAEIAKYRLHPESKGVAQIVKFNADMEQVMDRFFSQANIPPDIVQKRRAIYADMLLMIATNYARADQVGQAFHYLGKSLRYHPLRPRLFWLMLRIVEAKTHLSISDPLIERWFKFRSQRL
ncbi:MAG: glycosyltransferase [Anaerolineae bacterium]|nr:glycosyltransferase [Anaerolineae bacterium]